MMRRYVERRFGALTLGQVLRTNVLELNWHDYEVVHIDDQTVILERG